MKSININITGDLAVTNDVNHAIDIDQELIKKFSESNLNITNLECPVTFNNRENIIDKTGPVLNGSAIQIKEIFNNLNIGLGTLANNHIMDYGEKGLKDTMRFCESNNVETVGIGLNLEDAKEAFRKDFNGVMVSFVNIAENEWSSASEDNGGANPMDVIDIVKQIQHEKTQSDIVILIIHGGHEYYNLPSPRMQKQYRFYADNGADLIVGHHPHCISGYEIYGKVPIYYSLGNFLFTMTSKYEDWYKGLILNIEIKNSKIDKCELIPVQQSKDKYRLEVMSGEGKESILQRVSDYSIIINNENLLKEKWNEFADEKRKTYSNYFSIFNFVKNKYINAILYKLNVNKMFNNKFAKLRTLNLIRCEAHLDLSKIVLSKELKKQRKRKS